MNLEFEIYSGKTFRDLCKDIITRSESKKDQLDILLSDARTHIKGINDALTLLPQIKGILEVGIKNDEQLIKLSAVLQKLQSTELETLGGGDTGFLTDDEKQQLQNAVKEQVKDIKKVIDSSDVPSKVSGSNPI